MTQILETKLVCSISSMEQCEILVRNSNNMLMDEDPPARVHRNPSLPHEGEADIITLKNMTINDFQKESENDGDQNGVNCSHQVEKDETMIKSAELCHSQQPLLQVVQSDESNEELIEQDVKVCDVCGDAGREDLLVTCCRCIDGAEHTYCMRVMIQNVPDGDWLCEECSTLEDIDHQKLCFMAGGENKSKASMQCFQRKEFETVALASGSNKLADVQINLSPPKSCSPQRNATISQNKPSKGTHQGNIKPNHSNIDEPELVSSSTVTRLQTLRGTLLKSDSFNTVITKPRTRVSNDVPRRKNASIESSLIDTIGSKIVNRTMSFKSVNSGYSNSVESKERTLSPKLHHERNKEPKPACERSSCERKQSVKLDDIPCSSVSTGSNVSMFKASKKLVHFEDDAVQSPSSKVGSNDNFPDALSHSLESSNQCERTAVCSVGTLKSAANLLSQNVSNDACAARVVKEEVNRNDKLKAAIEAAMLKKPGAYGKKKEINEASRLISKEAMHEGKIQLECGRDRIGYSTCKFSSFPEYDYIWQGNFEVRRGNLLNLYCGMQAHLSSCASPRVLEAVKQFSYRIMLDEVPRLFTWPKQFCDIGAKEDNIALFFFAKNLESYKNSYRGLLDYMINQDLALKGSFGPAQFLVFPSTQLPEKSQRWNRLFFLWGVFRETRTVFSDSSEKLNIHSVNGSPLKIENLDNQLPNLLTSSVQHDTADSRSGASLATGNALLGSDVTCPSGLEKDNRIPTELQQLHWELVSSQRKTQNSSSIIVHGNDELEEIKRPFFASLIMEPSSSDHDEDDGDDVAAGAERGDLFLGVPQRRDDCPNELAGPAPNLELALGAEANSPPLLPPHHHFNKKAKHFGDFATPLQVGDLSSSLSLSLSFPFPVPDGERASNPVGLPPQ